MVVVQHHWSTLRHPACATRDNGEYVQHSCTRHGPFPSPAPTRYHTLAVMPTGALLRAVLALTVGLCLGHAAIVVQYQRDALLQELGVDVHPAILEHLRYHGVVERRTIALGQAIVVVCLSAAAARTWPEALALALLAYAGAGLGAGVEGLALGLQRVCWPVVPMGDRSPAGAVAAAHAALLVAVFIGYRASIRRWTARASSTRRRRPPARKAAPPHIARQPTSPEREGNGREGPQAR